jgi:Na+-driven multidrug efflux pump
VLAVVCYFAAPQIIELFISSDPEVVQTGTETLRWQCLSMPFLPLGTCCNMTFQTIGKSGVATFLSSARQGYVFLPLILLLPYLFGLRGVEMAQPLADIVTFAICIPFTVSFFRECREL